MTQPSPQSGREHEVGILAAPLLKFDFDREIQQLRSEVNRNSVHEERRYGMPPEQVVEIGTQVYL
jgi:K+ transporter